MTREPSLRILEFWILCAAIIRGLCLIEEPNAMIVHLGWPGAIQPTWLWGGMVAVLGVIGLVGQAWMQWGKCPYRWFLSLTAHSALTGAYLVFGIAALNYVMQDHTQQGHGTYATAFEIFGYGICHWIFANRSKSVVL
jgi:hypothetical protein